MCKEGESEFREGAVGEREIDEGFQKGWLTEGAGAGIPTDPSKARPTAAHLSLSAIITRLALGLCPLDPPTRAFIPRLAVHARDGIVKSPFTTSCLVAQADRGGGSAGRVLALVSIDTMPVLPGRQSRSGRSRVDQRRVDLVWGGEPSQRSVPIMLCLWARRQWRGVRWLMSLLMTRRGRRRVILVPPSIRVLPLVAFLVRLVYRREVRVRPVVLERRVVFAHDPRVMFPRQDRGGLTVQGGRGGKKKGLLLSYR
jgi:hypothetical protein